MKIKAVYNGWTAWKKPAGLVVVMMLLSVTSGSVRAGTIGRRYAGVEIGQIIFGDGDMKSFFGSAFRYGTNLRLPVNDNLDFLAAVGIAEAAGDQSWKSAVSEYYLRAEETQTSVTGGLQYQLPVTVGKLGAVPFINGEILWVKSESEVFLERRSGDISYFEYREQFRYYDLGFKIGGGVEINTSELYDGTEMFIDVTVNYRSEIFGNDDFTAGIGFSAWVTPKLLLRIGAQHALDSGNNVIQAGAAFGF